MAQLPAFLKSRVIAKAEAGIHADAEPVAVRKTSPLAEAIARARAERLAHELSANGADVHDKGGSVTDGEMVSQPITAPSEPIIRLFYHPESESYWTWNKPGIKFDSEELGDGMSNEVTDDLDAWAAFYAQELTQYEIEHQAVMPVAPLPVVVDVGFDEEIDSISGNVDADHLRRAAMQAQRMFNIMEGMSVTLDPSQVAAVHGLVKEQYGCLIGAAGTGKTTTTRALLHTLMNGDAAAGIEPVRITTVDMSQYRKPAGLDEIEEEDEAERQAAMERAATSRIPGIALVAFTGQATQVLRKNLPPAWRGNAMTIHSLLAFGPEYYTKADGSKSMRFVPGYTKAFKMPWDIIVVDEASMVNLELWHMLLDAARPGTRFYFIGDLNQLPPPVGLGILGFALAKWPVYELNVVHRQSDESANRIIDTAWAILEGKYDNIKFDDPQTNPNWRVIGFELAHETHIAHSQIIQLAKALSTKRVAASVDPETPLVYDPWRDRIMTPGNGYNPENADHLLGQFPINEALSRLFTDDSVPRHIIDCKRVTKKFAVGYRVMATKNEPPDSLDRVTNGMTGKIQNIVWNGQWVGDRRLFGHEKDVAENRRLMVIEAAANGGRRHFDQEAVDRMMSEDFESMAASVQNVKEEKQSGPSSHIVSVRFDNGAYREYSLNAEVEQLMIAYASTTHKAQGAEMPTAIVVVHHAAKFMLSRENLYTAVTRAKERVIVLYTQFGLRIALSKQKVSGRNLQEKIRSYIQMMGGEDGEGFKTVKVRLSAEEGEVNASEAVI